MSIIFFIKLLFTLLLPFLLMLILGELFNNMWADFKKSFWYSTASLYKSSLIFLPRIWTCPTYWFSQVNVGLQNHFCVDCVSIFIQNFFVQTNRKGKSKNCLEDLIQIYLWSASNSITFFAITIKMGYLFVSKRK